MTDASLIIKVDSSQAKTAAKSLDDLSVSGAKADKSTDQLTKSTKTLSDAARAATGIISALGLAFSAREIIAYSDAWTAAANQLRQVTKGSEDLTRVQSSLLSVANETRSSFDSTANLYSRLARATTEMGLSQTELIGITTTINKSFAASGATASEAAAAITQLSQGLASGALRGDEFNSVAEQAPGIMRAIAASLNLTVGELRNFAAEGGITAEIVVTALQEASDSIAGDFSKANITFGQSVQVAKNNVTAFIGQADAIGATVGSAGAVLIAMSENIDLIGQAAGLAGTVLVAKMIPAIVSSITAMASATTAAGAFSGALALLGGPVGAAIIASYAVYKLTEALIELRAEGYRLAGDDFAKQSLDVMNVGFEQAAVNVDAAREEIRLLRSELVSANEIFGEGSKEVDGLNRELDLQHNWLNLNRLRWAELSKEAMKAGGSLGGLEKTVQLNTVAVKQNIVQLDHGIHSTAAKTQKVNELIGSLSTVRKGYSDWIPLLSETEFRMQGVTVAVKDNSEAVKIWTAASTNGARQRAEAEIESARAQQDQWNDTKDFLAESFINIADNGKSAFSQIGDMAIATIKRIVAEWAAVKALEFFGFGSPSGGGGGGGSTAGNIVKSAATSAIGKTIGNIVTGGGTAAAGGSGIGATMAGAGSAIGGALSSAGSSIMGAIGAIPGWGWAVGGAALLANALAKDETPSANAGMLIRPIGNGDRQFDVDPFASGFDPTGFARREDQSKAVEVIDTFRQYDQALTNIAKASGLSVNYSSNNFGGFNEKGNGNGLYFGAATEDGKNTAVPIDQQLTQFVGQWIKGLSGQVDQSLINDVLSAGNADEMLKRAGAIAGIDGSHANGLDYVPFDGYRAQLHKGERVQTAAEARSSGEMVPMMAELLSAIKSLRNDAQESKVYNRRTAEILDQWQGEDFAVTT